MFGATKKKLATSSVGPKQKACLAKGGSWEGPVGKKTCVMPVINAGSQPPSSVGADGYPKPGTTNYGPAPAPPPGGWPAFKGAAGPKQKACTASGGSWIGPTGKKWCQMPQKAYAASSLTPTQSAPDTQTKDTAAAVAAKIFDSGGYTGTSDGLMPEGASMDNAAIPDVRGRVVQGSAGAPGGAGGPATASASVLAPSGGSSWGTPLLLVVGGAALYFLLKKKPKAGKLGTVRTTRSRTTRRRTR